MEKADNIPKDVSSSETFVRFVRRAKHLNDQGDVDYTLVFLDKGNDCSLRRLSYLTKERCILYGQEIVDYSVKKGLADEIIGYFVFCKEPIESQTFGNDVYAYRIICDKYEADPTHAVLRLVQINDELKRIKEKQLKREPLDELYNIILDELNMAIHNGEITKYYPASTFEITDYDTLLQPCLENNTP